MKHLLWLGLLGVLLLAAVGSGTPASTHYIPKAGDGFHYAETIVLNNGVGDYASYTEHFFYNGTVGVASVPPNLTANATYSNTLHWENSTGSSSQTSTGGVFTFSAVTFQYVQGTDGQTGLNNSNVWFYIDNTLTPGTGFYLLDDAMTLVSTDASYELPGPLAGYYQTLFAEGNGSYLNNGIYGNLTATYNWKAYFDPGTGYIVGYVYTEDDSNATAGFTWTDTLYVTSTSYALTPGSAPPASSSSGSSIPWLYIAVAIVVIVLVIVVIAVALRRRHRAPRAPPLAQHSATGQVRYGPPPTYPAGGSPPPINLTPSGEPAVQQIVIKETVKVKCAYCGALIDSTAKACPFCGAPRT